MFSPKGSICVNAEYMLKISSFTLQDIFQWIIRLCLFLLDFEFHFPGVKEQSLIYPSTPSVVSKYSRNIY